MIAAIAVVPETSALALKKPVALVIDDDDQSAEVLRRFLAAEGFAVVSSISAEDALLVALQHSFAVILLDLQMYSMNGWQFLKLMREGGMQPQVPVVIVSGHAIEGDIVRERGVAAAMQKPIRLAELKTILSNLGLLKDPTAIAG